MATEALKSTPITNLDATPPVRGTSGRTAAGSLIYVDGLITVTTAMETGSTYAMVRLPSSAVVKRVRAWLETAVTTFTVDIGLSYGTGRDVGEDLRGDVIDADFWGSAVALASIVVPTEYTQESTQATAADMIKPLWDAAGLSSDPGGTFDVVLTTTATIDGAAVVYLAVEYVMPGA